MDVLFQTETWISVALGYALGAVPFGLLLAKVGGLGDIRNIGSGNIGATNVLRTGNKKLAALTLALDLLKGTAAVLIAFALFGSPFDLMAGLGAFLGHIAPVWLKFKGGKGVATYLGVVLGLMWPIAIVFALVWLTTAYLTRYSSLSALLASVAVLAAVAIREPLVTVVVIALMTAVLLAKHHANVSRLLSGTESKIGGQEGSKT